MVAVWLKCFVFSLHIYPIIRRYSVALPVLLSIFPHIVVTVLVNTSHRLPEPFMLVARMIRHNIQQNTYIAPCCLRHKPLEIAHCSVSMVHIIEIRYIVTEILLRRLKHRTQPNCIHFDFVQMIQTSGDAFQITNAIAIAVRKRTWMNLINGRVRQLPPTFTRCRWWPQWMRVCCGLAMLEH